MLLSINPRQNVAKLNIDLSRRYQMPYYSLVCSTLDIASSNVANILLKEYDFIAVNEFIYRSRIYTNVQMIMINKIPLYADKIDEIYSDTGCFIFVSRHKSSSEIPTLTCHTTGNFNQNPYGGRPKEIGMCYPWIQKQYFLELYGLRHKVPRYDITIEATHHGPTSLEKPTLFVEIGSTEKEWLDPDVANIVCVALLEVVSKNPGSCERVAIGLGGTHYPSKFNKLILESEYGLATVAPRHNLQNLDGTMIQSMISRSIEKVSYFVYDTKGMGTEKKRVLSLVAETGLEIIKI
jgi:D-aminoacyl-tRNA deacylase